MQKGNYFFSFASDRFKLTKNQGETIQLTCKKLSH